MSLSSPTAADQYNYAEPVLADHYRATRNATLSYCEPLSAEDLNLQAADFASPGKWHIAHSSWFFETFILKPFVSDYHCFDSAFAVLFNSYYNGIGEQHPRQQRSVLSRPSIDRVIEYRQSIDEHMQRLLADTDHRDYAEICRRTTLGIHHEQQHQELFFTDIKYNFSHNPLYPAYSSASHHPARSTHSTQTLSFSEFAGGLMTVGVDSDSTAFTFDNESPRHQSFLQPFRFANRLISNAEYQWFIEDNGYRRAELWLSDGWQCVQQNSWTKPIYWRDNNTEFTLRGLQQRDPNAPVSHISAYEADAYARWASARLPTEFEWEHVASLASVSGNLLEHNHLHPIAVANGEAPGPQQLFGDVWEWTSSSYSPYPGFRAADNAIGEYNGKFMCNQLVLRGGSCVTPQSHIRASYRNFFYPPDRWQFSGIRLAQTID